MSRLRQADWTIIYEDRELWVVAKEAGLAVQSRSQLQKDLENELRAYAGGAPCFLVHRLDQPVEGLMVVAKTKQAAAVLTRQLVGNELSKDYLAVVTGGSWERPQGRLIHRLEKQATGNRSIVVQEPRGKIAALTYRVLAQGSGQSPEQESEQSLVFISLESGRHHQIRVQLAAVGHPLSGDEKYGAHKQPGLRGLALCACHLTFAHPCSGEVMEFCRLPNQPAFQPYRQVISQWMAEEWRLTDV